MNLFNTIKTGILVGKYIVGLASIEEKRILKEWVSENDANRGILERLVRDKEIASGIAQYDLTNVERSWKQYNEKIVNYRLKNQLIRWRIAAVLFLLIGITGLISNNLFFIGKFGDNAYTTVSTSYGESSRIILPDSSLVWLNSGTSVTYGVEFNEGTREIVLTGEAFFEVAKNEKSPFIVRCDGIDVKVLGTSFNVSNYSDENNIDVVLETGQVEIIDKESNKIRERLRPGERAKYSRIDEKLVIDDVDTQQYTSWKNGILIFRNEPMIDAVKTLERRYDVNIEVKEPQINQLIFNATILNEDIEDILELIKFSCSINYKIIPSHHPDVPTKIEIY